jgi:hypothetical protein
MMPMKQSSKKIPNVDSKDSELSCNEFSESFFRSSIMSAKEYSSLIKSSEKLIRTSQEYSNFVYTIHEVLGLNNDAVFAGIKREEGNTTKFEVDHYPFTLYELCEIVINKYIESKIQFNTFMVADEVMRLHYDGLVGVVVLSKTTHQLRHSGVIFIDLRQVCGNFIEFVRQYNQYISPEVKERLKQLVECSKGNIPMSVDPNLFKVKPQSFYNNENQIPRLEYEDP